MVAGASGRSAPPHVLCSGSPSWHPPALGAYDTGELIFGLLVLPVVVVIAMYWRARRNPAPARTTGLLGHGLLLALFLTPWYAPSMRATSDGLLVYLGVAMLLAAARGDPGCEVMAVPNWFLRRQDRVGCLVNSPVDRLERRRSAGRPEVG